MRLIQPISRSGFCIMSSLLLLACGGGSGAINAAPITTDGSEIQNAPIYIDIPATAIVDETTHLVTEAAKSEMIGLLNKTLNYPSQWTWGPVTTVPQPRAATTSDKLTPKIEHLRDGKVIATYANFGSRSTCTYTSPTASVPMNLTQYAAAGCGPFGNIDHRDLFRIAKDGDNFLVYPAVYTGPENNIFISTKSDYYGDTTPHPPTNITIQGVTENGVRPVILNVPAAGDFASAQSVIYIWNKGSSSTNAVNITIANIDLAIDKSVGRIGKAGLYSNGSTNLTLKQMRIHGFKMENGNSYGANGIFATGNDAGVFTLDQIELFDNGGVDGPAHNIYINTSVTDPNYTVHMKNSWSHDAFYGHLFKSRAQVNILEGNYFQGGLPKGDIYTQAENYLVNIPNGGKLIMKNNILVKNASGKNSNGASVTYNDEGLSSDTSTIPRNYFVDIRNNTFVVLSLTYDGTHPSWPFFFYKQTIPGTTEFKVPTKSGDFVIPTVFISNNVFSGYIQQTYPSYLFMNYRGIQSTTVALNELALNFALITPYYAASTTNRGATTYMHPTQQGPQRRVYISAAKEYTRVGAID